jgi:hypothetical protein
MLQQYFDRRTGRQLRQDEALDEHGVLRDGVIQRVRMSARDSRMPRFANDDFQLNRPGFRTANTGTPLADMLTRDAKAEAYAAHRDYLENSWRKPSGKVADAAEEEPGRR